jgi:hypothetical protein
MPLPLVTVLPPLQEAHWQTYSRSMLPLPTATPLPLLSAAEPRRKQRKEK